MANELKHASVGGSLSQAEWESVVAHILDAQATGDLVYASSAAQLRRLGIGSQGQLLRTSGGIPAWTDPSGVGLDYGLSFQAIVTTYTDTTHFKASGLTGKGNGYFKGYSAYVVWDAGGAGAAPQGELVAISDYVSADGTFAHAAFTTPLAVTDEVLIINPRIVPSTELLTYSPGLQDTADLEAATRTITATVEATGVGLADYSAALTLPAPSDTRLAVIRITARLAATIDSMTAGTLYCRVYVDAQAAGNRLFDLSWTTTGAKLAAVGTHSGNLATIFALLKDGGAHTFYFFFWVNAGNAVLSLVELWEGVGAVGEIGPTDGLELTHTGLVSSSVRLARVGSGSYYLALWDGIFNQANFIKDTVANTILGHAETLALVKRGVVVGIGGTVATDLNYLLASEFVLRREQ